MCWLEYAANLRHLPHLLLVILAVPGLVECFAGFQAWRFLLGLNGVCVGAPAGFFLGLIFLHNPVLALAGALAGAIGGAALFATVMPAGTFMVGCVSGFSITMNTAALLEVPFNGWASVLAVGIGAAAAGTMILADRPAIIVLSALFGAQQLAGLTTAYLIPEGLDSAVATALTHAGLLVVLAAGGMASQWALERNRRAMEVPATRAMAAEGAAESSAKRET